MGKEVVRVPSNEEFVRKHREYSRFFREKSIHRNKLEALIRTGQLKVDPLKEEQLIENQIALTLANKVGRYLSDSTIDLSTGSFQAETIDITESGYMIPPGGFVLVGIEQTVILPNTHCGWVYARNEELNSMVLVHLNEGLIEATFPGRIALEVANLHPTDSYKLTPNAPICYFVLQKLTSPATKQYDGNYRYQPIPSFYKVGRLDKKS